MVEVTFDCDNVVLIVWAVEVGIVSDCELALNCELNTEEEESVEDCGAKLGSMIAFKPARNSQVGEE